MRKLLQFSLPSGSPLTGGFRDSSMEISQRGIQIYSLLNKLKGESRLFGRYLVRKRSKA
jgi:hypothetical protein